MKDKNKNKCICIIFSAFLFIVFLTGVFGPKNEYSRSERRKLAEIPKVSWQAVKTGKFMKDYDKYTLDQFPLRDWMRSVKALTSDKIFQKLDNNDLYIDDDYIAAMEYPVDQNSISYAGRRFRYIIERYLEKDQKVFLSVIPDKNYFMAEESGHLSMDAKEVSDILSESVPSAQYVDIIDLLQKEDYYRTDTHWRQEKITDVAHRLADQMGVTIPDQYTEVEVTDDFYGVYYGQAALPVRPEKLVYLTNDRIENMIVTDRQNNRVGKVYDLKKAEGKDPYEMFLSGPLSLVEVENKNPEKDKNLIIFRDSFGSSIAPLLAQGYEKTILVDIRYLQSTYLENLVDFENADVLFLYSTLVLNNSSTLK